MKKIKICKFCVLDETIPEVIIDVNGKCNFCKKYDKYKIEKKKNKFKKCI